MSRHKNGCVSCPVNHKKCVLLHSDCISEIFVTEAGIITSPNYPGSYPNDAECLWVLRAAPGQRIQLILWDVDIEEADDCEFDVLVVSDV